ncbi:MAG TPA: tRNA glutamyl-Q(34) synthetase GluQRS [Methylotenera sp.]|nr:tRNA glutamyl-Q(34) synthetase GluQRS [Methylotenera sp.]HPV43906.1 tRNA glutamyl-Q(34) synthetase GluQRS [Methylotenera sp.]
MPYVGRFAPSPTGPLHFGSLVAAVASYCDAKAKDGKWLLRMEDLDKPREVQGAADGILRTLEAFGFEWDREAWYQSQRTEFYESALQILKNKGLAYPCTCSRKEIADSAIASGIEGAIYPKTCLNHALKTNIHEAYRALTLDENIVFLDEIQGEIIQNLARDVGDFILKRADGLFAYQLAVVVDDAAQGVTHVVRGADLLDSTPRQIYLQRLLGYATPHYAHVPVASNAAGEKLSKQTLARPIDMRPPGHALFDALSFLGQHPPAEIKSVTPDEIWQWAITNWRISSIPKQRAIIFGD